jgi:hypothetical protein
LTTLITTPATTHTAVAPNHARAHRGDIVASLAGSPESDRVR